MTRQDTRIDTVCELVGIGGGALLVDFRARF